MRERQQKRYFLHLSSNGTERAFESTKVVKEPGPNCESKVQVSLGFTRDSMYIENVYRFSLFSISDHTVAVLS